MLGGLGMVGVETGVGGGGGVGVGWSGFGLGMVGGMLVVCVALGGFGGQPIVALVVRPQCYEAETGSQVHNSRQGDRLLGRQGRDRSEGARQGCQESGGGVGAVHRRVESGRVFEIPG